MDFKLTKSTVGTARQDGGLAMQRQMPGAAALLVVGLLVSGCSTSPASSALGTQTARVFINGTELADQPGVRCTQTGWVWFIETEQDEPGFTAQVRTGATVEPRLVRINGLGGFTGGFSDVTFGSAEASVADGTLVITGTAEGAYDDTPLEPATADFEFRTDC